MYPNEKHLLLQLLTKLLNFFFSFSLTTVRVGIAVIVLTFNFDFSGEISPILRSPEIEIIVLTSTKIKPPQKNADNSNLIFRLNGGQQENGATIKFSVQNR